VLSPLLMRAGVELHPLLVLFGVFAGTELVGIPGAFLSVPVLAFIRIIYRFHPPAAPGRGTGPRCARRTRMRALAGFVLLARRSPLPIESAYRTAA
jgi:hypothetical protein